MNLSVECEAKTFPKDRNMSKLRCLLFGGLVEQLIKFRQAQKKRNQIDSFVVPNPPPVMNIS